MTVRRWVRDGILGNATRQGLNRICLPAFGVLQFENKYIDLLGLGEPVLTVGGVCRRYNRNRATIYRWLETSRFPPPERIPYSICRRWRESKLQQWERAWGITPVFAMTEADRFVEGPQ